MDLKKIDNFRVIEIETYHGCNLNCWSCPNSKIEKHGELMKEEVYFKILDDLKKHDFQGRISPYDMNEPTLDKRLPDWIARTRKMFPNNTIYIGSNGIAIDQDYVRMILAKGLSQILITCYSEEVYNKFKSIDDNKTVRLLKIFEQDREKVFMNRGGGTNVGGDVLVRRICEKGLRQVMINYLGDMVFCCSDYFYTTIAGNVMDKDLYELWNCEKFKQAREFLSRGEREKIELCSKCNFLRTEEDDIKKGLKADPKDILIKEEEYQKNEFIKKAWLKNKKI